ncbi:MAG: glutamate--cysteine ligase [Candidatus Dactylopiibacterium carminicum]|uniref:Glutamate--cysteine ligase n=1 Tax=Candidatus Dactylopiibacterium carminicum TaxID=857335 RepID=A0A272EWV0_9RHOO|nr:glutamate--cysteine ligase [Candidatus Dactylopiibacterium carminicum]KAF7600012.1 glutamate--cysteine ligase [Candidatus Dactylopiibacterium carminicum]PAS94598.1 MAG: glutamate--cysteine ligase [Candidatus Dactylopiibacterium carminicum]PAS97637.1 MAG: glutamate--cysteine ligase [Candidatus Dactylopiibacterium carminicum]PAT00017.1 MAG: glutamate--cysteine ligase [Candidatus Dactylopiibacterium carminicum]
MVPHLTTALSGPLLALEQTLLDNATRIEQWFRNQWIAHTPPFYGSVDLRNSGFKLAPVDMNLFPGGFNNLGEELLPLCVQAANAAVERLCPKASKLLLIPENYTRNLFYLQNVARIASILGLTGMEVRIGSLLPDLTEPMRIELPEGGSLLLEPLQRHGNRLGLAGFDPCAILLNNDLSAGAPDILQGLEGQRLLPPLHAGWATRRKSLHFAAYDQVVAEFASLLGLDPWLLNPYFGRCGQINFHERTGEDCLAAKIDGLLARIRVKYAEYGVTETPFVVVKADAGTYGMGVMTVHDASEVIGLNRRQRNKMSVVKEGLQVSEVIIQEGVHTLETVNGGVAEPVVYMMDHYVIGGFYRVHGERGRDENLNAPGMHFEPLAFETCCNIPDCRKGPDAAPNRFYAYGVVACLALLAGALELEQTAPAEVVAA